jgi:hypothetical protein
MALRPHAPVVDVPWTLEGNSQLGRPLRRIDQWWVLTFVHRRFEAVLPRHATRPRQTSRVSTVGSVVASIVVPVVVLIFDDLPLLKLAELSRDSYPSLRRLLPPTLRSETS